MKRFIKKLLAFVLAFISVLTAVNFAYVKLRKLDTDKFSAIPETIQICNFGSSHGRDGFNYENIESEYNCFNFGLSSQTLSYDYRLFQYYGDHIVAGTIVFIPISYFSLFGTDETSRDEFFAKNKRYYSILPASLIKEYDYKTNLYVKYLPALATDTSNLIKALLGKPENAFEQLGVEDISIHAKYRFESHVGDNKMFYDGDGHRIENQEEIGALYALIKECQKKGAVPILITTPYLHEYTDIIKENTPDFYDQFYSIIDRVVRDTGAEYYDYAFDERFASEYSWFLNSDHLNKEGARNFTNIVMQEIVYAKGYLDK